MEIKRCSFCGKEKEKDYLVSPIDSSKIICISCLNYVSEVKDEALSVDDRKKFKPDESMRTD